MAESAVRKGDGTDEFARLHRLFVEHLGAAVVLLWTASLVASFYAPWLRNIRGLLDPLGRPESTASFLFALPAVLTLGWIGLVYGGDLIRRASLMRNQTLEFVFAGIATFAIFCMAVGRVVTAVSLAV